MFGIKEKSLSEQDCREMGGLNVNGWIDGGDD